MSDHEYSYAVVEFVDEQASEVVHKSWMETKDTAVYCYWPKNNAHLKAKQKELPDKEVWSYHKVRVLSYTENFEKAIERARKSEFTSSLETDEDEPKTRRRPKRNWSDSENTADEACVKIHGVPESKVEAEIGENLKHAPNKEGGSKYKAPRVIREVDCAVMQFKWQLTASH